MESRPAKKIRKAVKPKLNAFAEFLRGEAIGGIVLVAATIVAILWANSQWSDGYFSFWGTDLTINLGVTTITHDYQHWVNDALMVIFFFVVALEIKRELVDGELKGRKAATTPFLVAIGGVVVPALIFVAINLGHPEELGGWAIPVATDIAFAIGILALLSGRILPGLKVFFVSFAIVDDIIAIVIIAIFYTAGLSLAWMGLVIACIGLIIIMRRLGIASPWWYLPIGLVVWLATYESGVHATIAGVILGLLTPAGNFHGRNVLEDLEHRLHPISSYIVIPIFALANAGVVLGVAEFNEAASTTLAWGIVAGLVVGKFIGIGGTAWLIEKFGISSLPAGVTTRMTWAIAGFAGIGFTMSLFITQLSFEHEELIYVAKIGVFSGSLISAAVGTIMILRATRGQRYAKPTAE